MAISPKRRQAILAAHGGVCHYCAAPDASHIDHIVPRVDGGSDDLGNLIAACLPCNLRKLRHRLPPDAERRALSAAEAARDHVRQIERTIKTVTRPKNGDSGAIDQRVQVMATAEQVARVKTWAVANGIRSLGAAIRELLRLGLKAP